MNGTVLRTNNMAKAKSVAPTLTWEAKTVVGPGASQ